MYLEKTKKKKVGLRKVTEKLLSCIFHQKYVDLIEKVFTII